MQKKQSKNNLNLKENVKIEVAHSFNDPRHLFQINPNFKEAIGLGKNKNVDKQVVVAKRSNMEVDENAFNPTNEHLVVQKSNMEVDENAVNPTNEDLLVPKSNMDLDEKLDIENSNHSDKNNTLKGCSIRPPSIEMYERLSVPYYPSNQSSHILRCTFCRSMGFFLFELKN